MPKDAPASFNKIYVTFFVRGTDSWVLPHVTITYNIFIDRYNQIR